MLLQSGLGPGQMVEGFRELFGGQSPPTASPPPSDSDFEQWKHDYESRGWQYSEKNGLAEFEPTEGATNENGWVYSEERGGFLPPEDQRPQPEAPPADSRYREEVRLLQEDLERQRDLLDRERERLRQYEESGLGDLTPGVRERIRQYEKLSELNEKELVRLDENRPTHTVEDHSDVKHDAGERIRSRETIDQIHESEDRYEAIQKKFDTETNRVNATREAEEMVSRNYDKLHGKIQEITDQRIEEGYYVRNSTLLKKAWNNLPPGRAIEWAGGWKGGQCGEYGKWGADWSKDTIRELFGGDSLVTTIAADSNPYLGHRATKVILPDGRRIVIDYWEGMPEGKPSISSETEWIKRWHKNLWGDYLGEPFVVRHPDELNLKDYIANWGEDEGMEKFRNFHSRRGKPGYAETLIRSWEKEPW